MLLSRKTFFPLIFCPSLVLLSHIFLLFLSSCGSKAEQTVLRLSLVPSKLRTSLSQGGMILYGQSDKHQFSYPFKNDETDLELTLPNGNWEFHALTYEGPGPLEGGNRCGLVNQQLSGGKAEIILNLSQEQCAHLPFFGSAEFKNRSGLLPLTLYSCLNTDEIKSREQSCNFRPGHFQSVKIKIPKIPLSPRGSNLDSQGNWEGALLETFSSSCLNLSENVLGETLTKIRLPLGNGANPLFSFKLEAFRLADCQGSAQTTTYSRGPLNAESLTSSLSKFLAPSLTQLTPGLYLNHPARCEASPVLSRLDPASGSYNEIGLLRKGPGSKLFHLLEWEENNLKSKWIVRLGDEEGKNWTVSDEFEPGIGTNQPVQGMMLNNEFYVLGFSSELYSYYHNRSDHGDDNDDDDDDDDDSDDDSSSTPSTPPNTTTPSSWYLRKFDSTTSTWQTIDAATSQSSPSMTHWPYDALVFQNQLWAVGLMHGHFVLVNFDGSQWNSHSAFYSLTTGSASHSALGTNGKSLFVATSLPPTSTTGRFHCQMFKINGSAVNSVYTSATDSRPELAQGSTQPCEATKIHFLNEQIGFAAMETGEDKWLVLRTIDGGNSWSVSDYYSLNGRYESTPFGITSDSKGNIYVSGAVDDGRKGETYRAILKQSTDQGLTWKILDDSTLDGLAGNFDLYMKANDEMLFTTLTGVDEEEVSNLIRKLQCQ